MSLSEAEQESLSALLKKLIAGALGRTLSVLLRMATAFAAVSGNPLQRAERSLLRAIVGSSSAFAFDVGGSASCQGTVLD